jgi:hypothetical protein
MTTSGTATDTTTFIHYVTLVLFQKTVHKMIYLNSCPYSASYCMDMRASGTLPNLLSQLQPPSLQFRGHCLETKQSSITAFPSDVPHGFPHYLQKIRGPTSECVTNICSHTRTCRIPAVDTGSYSVQTSNHLNYDFTYAV